MSDEKLAGEPRGWVTPVYMQKQGLEQFAVCKHCDLIRRDHVGEEEKCLFDASTFAVSRKLKK